VRYLRRRVVAEATSRLIPAFIVAYTAYLVGMHAVRGISPHTWPLITLNAFSLAGTNASILAYYAIITTVAVAIVASGYYAFTIGSTHKAVTALGIIPLVSASLGNLRMGDVILVAMVSLLLLYIYPYRRRYIIGVSDKGVSASGWRPGSTVSAALFYAAPPLLAIGGSAIVAAAISFTANLNLGVPPPLPDIWRLFASTRLAYILIAILVTVGVLWVIGEFAGGLLLFYTLTPRDAVSRASRILLEEEHMLKSWSTWHQRIIIWSASTIMGVLSYPIMYGVTWRLLGRLGASMPGWMMMAVDLAAVILVWRVFHIYVRRVVVHRGEAYRSLLAVPLSLVVLYTVLSALGLLPQQPLYYALGLRPPSSRGDVLAGVWNDKYIGGTLEGMFKEFERIARIVIKLLWG